MATYADDLNKTIAQSGGSMKSLIPAPAKPPEIKPVAPSATANVSSALPQTQAAVSGLDEARTVTPQQTVAGQMKELLDSPSPYLEQARESGLRVAASRGMVNSALAAGHSEQAAIAAALPIATQDASTYAQAARQYQAHLESLIQQANAGDINAQLQLQNAGYNSQLSAQEHTQRLVEAAQQGDINARLQLQQGLQSSVLQRQQGDINSRLQQEQGNIQAKLDQARFAHDKVMQQLQQQGQLELQNNDFQHQQSMLGQQFQNALQMSDKEAAQWVSQQNLLHQQTLEQIDVQARNSLRADQQQQSAAIQGQYLGQVSQLQMATNQELTAIYSTSGLTGAQQQTAAQNAINRYNSNVTALRAQYETSPLWHDDFGNPSTPVSTPAQRITLPAPVRAGGTLSR